MWLTITYPFFNFNSGLTKLVMDKQSLAIICQSTPESKVHGANMEPTWGRQDPDGPHVGPMNFAIWDLLKSL